MVGSRSHKVFWEQEKGFGLCPKANEKLLRDFREKVTRFALKKKTTALARECSVYLHYLIGQTASNW